MSIEVKISVGDFLDRWSILLIKLDKGLDVDNELIHYVGKIKKDSLCSLVTLFIIKVLFRFNIQFFGKL